MKVWEPRESCFQWKKKKKSLMENNDYFNSCQNNEFFYRVLNTGTLLSSKHRNLHVEHSLLLYQKIWPPFQADM